MQLDLFALLQIPEQYIPMIQRYAAAMILLAILIMITRQQTHCRHHSRYHSNRIDGIDSGLHFCYL
jgi:hypothetical protein